MVIIKVIKGNLLDAKERYIAHQTNCVTIKSRGLSKSLFDKFSYVNVYSRRKAKTKNCAIHPDEPGTLVISYKDDKDDKDDKIIINMMGQWLPGKPGSYKDYYPKTYVDTKKKREEWFAECIDALDTLNYDMVAMPYKIGCGLAGGNWKKYKEMLENSITKIVLYKIE